MEFTKDDYILSTEKEPALSADEIARKFEMYEEDLKTAEKMINGKSYSEAVCGMMSISGIMETVSKLPKSERRIELLGDCETVISKGFTQFNELDAEKEPASAGTPTSSYKIIPDDTITLPAENVKLQVEFLRMVSDTLDEVYQSTDYNAISPTLATGFGRAWGILDCVINTLVDMLKAGGQE